ncbi:hypothetical protein [Desulforegula conservatrix]|uniref:hypothetical protein n=1 Tax=Desulforegula conservatrix TaxID=153026 RepID=UPI0003FCCAFE|nr:hypothetical protein [Desulforegula conservatrix]
MKTSSLAVLSLTALVLAGLLSCSRHNASMPPSKTNYKIKFSDYKLKSEYRFTTPEKSFQMYRVSDWWQWFKPSLTKDFHKPKWLVKRKDIEIIQAKGFEYLSQDGSYQLKIPYLSSENMYFADYAMPHEGRNKFVIIDENNWIIGILSSDVMRDPTYTEYFKVRSPEEAFETVVRRDTSNAEDTVVQNYGRFVPAITKTFRYEGIPVFEEYVRCSSPMDSPRFILIGTGHAKCTTIKHLKRQLVKNGYLYEISVYLECKSENEDECHTEEKVYELADYILKNIKFLKKTGE